MTIFLGLLSVAAVFLALLVMLVVLVQEPKGGGVGSALGGGGMSPLSHDSGRVCRVTCALGGVWVLSCFLHAVLMPSLA